MGWEKPGTNIDNWPLKRKAGGAVEMAKRRGELIPEPCIFCGDPKTEAHHHSYKERDWLKVTWLCSLHHHMVHRDENRAIQEEVDRFERESVNGLLS